MISLPTDLKKRMEKSGQNVNWSAVARQAFEDTLAAVNQGSREVHIQVFESETAGAHVPINEYIDDVSLTLAHFMSAMREGRREKYPIGEWHQDMRIAAHEVNEALKNLQETCNRFAGDDSAG